MCSSNRLMKKWVKQKNNKNDMMDQVLNFEMGNMRRWIVSFNAERMNGIQKRTRTTSKVMV